MPLKSIDQKINKKTEYLNNNHHALSIVCAKHENMFSTCIEHYNNWQYINKEKCKNSQS